MKRLYTFLVSFIAASLYAGVVHAVQLQVDYPAVDGQPFSGGGPLAWLRYIYFGAFAVIGIVAFGSLVYAGIKWMTSRSESGVSDAKDRIQKTLLGLLLAGASVLILQLINPDLVNLREPRLPLPNAPERGEYTPNNPEDGLAQGDGCNFDENGQYECGAGLFCMAKAGDDECEPMGRLCGYRGFAPDELGASTQNERGVCPEGTELRTRTGRLQCQPIGNEFFCDQYSNREYSQGQMCDPQNSRCESPLVCKPSNPRNDIGTCELQSSSTQIEGTPDGTTDGNNPSPGDIQCSPSDPNACSALKQEHPQAWCDEVSNTCQISFQRDETLQPPTNLSIDGPTQFTSNVTQTVEYTFTAQSNAGDEILFIYNINTGNGDSAGGSKTGVANSQGIASVKGTVTVRKVCMSGTSISKTNNVSVYFTAQLKSKDGLKTSAGITYTLSPPPVKTIPGCL